MKSGAESARGFAMQPGRGARRLEGLHALREQPRDHAGEHIARARRGERSGRIGVDDGAAVGRGDDRVGALEQHDRMAPRRRRARARKLAARRLREIRKSRANSPSWGVRTERLLAFE